MYGSATMAFKKRTVEDGKNYTLVPPFPASHYFMIYDLVGKRPAFS